MLGPISYFVMLCVKVSAGAFHGQIEDNGPVSQLFQYQRRIYTSFVSHLCGANDVHIRPRLGERFFNSKMRAENWVV